MIIRKVDSNNDWQFGKGLSDYAQDDAAIQQNIQSRLLSWVGDCFFALQEGVDWKNRLEPRQKDNVTQEVKTIILQSEGVISVNTVSVQFLPDTRLFTIQYDAETIFSESFQQFISQAAGT